MASEPLVVIVGETASGKSNLALRLAEHYNGEIVAADATTVYTGFSIGTAKPSMQDRRTVPHHLIDIANPEDGFSAAIFHTKAEQAIQEISDRGNIPFLVGGTGLYIDSVLYNYEFLPPPPVYERSRLSAMTIPELLSEAKQKQIDTDQIDIRNKRRIIRLIENNGRLPKKSALREDTLVLGLGVPRGELQSRIENRVDTMFALGLVQEVDQLRARYGWDCEPMKAIGYREFKEYFDGTQSISETRMRIIAGTLRLAKKQRTWFRRNKSIHWISEQEEAVDLLTSFLNKYRR